MMQPHKIKVKWCGAAAERADDREPIWRQIIADRCGGARKLNPVDLQAPSLGTIEAAISPDGQAGWGVDVTWPDTDTVRAEFYGDGYGPTAMTTRLRDGTVVDDRYVKVPGMFGAQPSPSWIRRFFGHGSWNADCILESKELLPHVVSCLVGGFDSLHVGSEGLPRWMSFARLTPQSVVAFSSDLESKPAASTVYAFPITHDCPPNESTLSVEWVSNFLAAPVVGDHHVRHRASR